MRLVWRMDKDRRANQ